jgi:predicted O-methyltransferase YrrM
MLPFLLSPSILLFSLPSNSIVKLPIDIESVKGFLDADEGEALYRYGYAAAELGPVLEVGSYCGKSTLYLGTACQMMHVSLYAVDHHRGSEEHQPGEEYHDTALFDSASGLMDSFWEFRHNMRRANLDDTVVPIVSTSAVAASSWKTPLGMVFIDGGHSQQAAQADYQSWVHHIVSGGVLAIHDIFPDPNEGGQAPYEIFKLALESGNFEEVERVKTLGILRRV